MTADLTEDRLLGGRVRLAQPATGYRVGIEPVLLAASLAPSDGARVLDLGTGVGAASLCLLARRPDLLLTGIELDPRAASLARANAELNATAARFAVLEQDVLALASDEPPFAAVMSNPPFHEGRASDPSPDAARARATIESDLAGWVAVAARVLEPRGTLTLIYRADRLEALLAALAPRFGGVAILPLWPRPAVPAKRVIVRAALGSRAALTLHPGLVLHGDGNSYTPTVAAILRDAAPIEF